MTTVTTTAQDQLVITAWSAMSGYGRGRQAFIDGIRSGRTTESAVDPEQWNASVDRACLVPHFTVRDALGKKGTRAMDRGTGLALCAVRDLLDDLGPDAEITDRDDTGLVLATAAGSVQSMMDFTRASLVEKRPFYVDPALMPFGVMNVSAGHCAIWHQFRGPNATLAAGRSGVLFALRYARRLLRRGRAQRVLVGAAEEFSNARSWVWWRGQGAVSDSQAPLGEGAVIFLVESARAVGPGREVLAEVRAVESRTFVGDDPTTALRACVTSALADCGLVAEDIDLVALSGAAGVLGDRERQAVDDVVGRHAEVPPPVNTLLGEVGGASAGFQISAVLSQPATGSAARTVLVTAVDDDGTASCAILGVPNAG